MTQGSAQERSVAAIILAAGKGERMRSNLPKVMHEACGKPLVHWVVDAVMGIGLDIQPIILVTGAGRESVESSWNPKPDWLEFALQEQQLGTGHAVDMARDFFSDEAARAHTDVFVLCGDGPLIRSSTLARLHERHVGTGAAATLATGTLEDPDGYGRIQRDPDGGLDRIVEQKDASPEQLQIREVNPSYYIFRADALFDRLSLLGNDNASGEYYVTDIFEMVKKDGLRVEVVDAVPSEDVLSINNPEQLAEVDAILRTRLGTQAAELDVQEELENECQ